MSTVIYLLQIYNFLRNYKEKFRDFRNFIFYLEQWFYQECKFADILELSRCLICDCQCNKVSVLHFSRMGTVSAAEWHFRCLFLQYKRHDAMIEKTKQQRKSSLDTLIEELDEMYIKNGWKVPEWAEPDPTRHRIIVRMPRQQKA